MQMILWGFISQSMANNTGLAGHVSGVLIGAVLLWDVLFRSQLGLSINFLEEMWSRNLANLFVSPLRPNEWLVSLVLTSLTRTLIGVVPAAILAIPFYGYSIFSLGLPLIAFFMNLIVMGWSIGFVVIGAILRLGMGAETLAWMAVFIISPFSAIYYPVSILPDWMQYIAWFLPSSHIFEGLRSLVFNGDFPFEQLIWSASLNIIYMIVSIYLFHIFFNDARRRGALMKTGE